MLSEMSQTAIFLSSPRFDQDFILDVKMVGIDHNRCLCVLITDFGVIKTEVLYTDSKLSSFTLKRIEQYIQAKISARQIPEMTQEEEKLASRFYSEVMLRHIVSYNNFSHIDIIKTGFSRLLSQSDFTEDAQALAMGLSFFENSDALSHILSESGKAVMLRCWVADEIFPLASDTASNGCAVMTIPYKINQTIVGSIGLLGPARLPYKELSRLLHIAAEGISASLTRSLYKFKISFRQPQTPFITENQNPTSAVGAVSSLLIEEKNTKSNP
jgi:heat-inducible transcriptional repressor